MRLLSIRLNDVKGTEHFWNERVSVYSNSLSLVVILFEMNDSIGPESTEWPEN